MEATRQLTERLTKVALDFQRDFYISTKEEMKRDWFEREDYRAVLPAIYDGLEPVMQTALEEKFANHNPLWEYAKAFTFMGSGFDPRVQRNVIYRDFYLDEDVHRDIADKELKYLITPDDNDVGLATFITRFGVKTYLVIINGCSWVLTRHRVKFDDFTTNRIIHEIEPEAVKRAEEVKRIHMYCRPLRALYPEVALPPGTRWMNEQEWDLPGREAVKTIDPQVRAVGLNSRDQGAHPFYNWLDDLEGKETQTSETTRERGKQMIGRFQYSTQIGMARYVLAGTFYHPAGAHAGIAEAFADKNKKGPKWVVIHLPGIIDENTENERPLLPKSLPIKALHKIRDQEIDAVGNDLNWRMQIMLDFKASTSYAFDMDCWQEIDLEAPETEGDRRILEAVNDGCPTYAFADFAGKDDETKGRGDLNAIEVWAFPTIDGQVHRVMLDAHTDDISTLDEACAIQLEMARNYDCWGVIAEEAVAHRVVGTTLNTIATQKGYINYYQTFIKNKQMGTIITLKPKKMAAQGMGAISSWKMARMNKFQLVFNQRRVWINSQIDQDILDAFQDQLRPFPFIKKDDILDAASQADDDTIAAKLPQPRVKKTPISRRPLRETVIANKYTGLRVKK